MWSAAPALLGDIAATRALLDETAIDTADLQLRRHAREQQRLRARAGSTPSPPSRPSPRGPTGTLQRHRHRGGRRAHRGRAGQGRGAEHQPHRAHRRRRRLLRWCCRSAAYRVTASRLRLRRARPSRAWSSPRAPTTVADFALAPAPRYAVSGMVRDGSGRAAGRRPGDHPGDAPAARGHRRRRPLQLRQRARRARYEVRAEAGRCFEQQTQTLVVDGDETLDFTLAQRRTPSATPASSVAAQLHRGRHGAAAGRRPGAASACRCPSPSPSTARPTRRRTSRTNGLHRASTPELGRTTSTAPSPIPSRPTPPSTPSGTTWSSTAAASVRTAAAWARAPNRQFVIEWRDVAVLRAARPAGALRDRPVRERAGPVPVRPAHRRPAPAGQLGHHRPRERERHGGLPVLRQRGAVLDPARGILFSLPALGLRRGDGHRRQRRPADRRAPRCGRCRTGRSCAAATTNAGGRYRMQVPVGGYVVQAGRGRLRPAGGAGHGGARPDRDGRTSRCRRRGPRSRRRTVELVVKADQIRKRTLTLQNTGTLPLDFEIAESGGKRQTVVSTARHRAARGRSTPTPATPGACCRRACGRPGWAPTAAGDVIRSFTPTGMMLAWGVGPAGHALAVGSAGQLATRSSRSRGRPPGASGPPPGRAAGRADMAYDASRGPGLPARGGRRQRHPLLGSGHRRR